MTFYEAALQILQREGRPLHAREITELALKENLLSHVGMQPELTMASRLAAMARRSQDRRLIATEADTFGLTDWNVEASPEALEQSGLPESHDEEEPPLRSRERHPRVDKENVRVSGRGDRRRKLEELERRRKKKKKRLPPLPELVHEILDRAGRALPVFDLAASIREAELVAEDLGRAALESALRAENERREDEGRSPIFSFDFEEGGLVGLAGRAEPAEEADLAALVADVVAKLAAERRPAEAPALPAAPAVPTDVDRFVEAARAQAVQAIHQRLLQLDAQALDAVATAMLAAMGYRDVRIAKRSKDGSLLTARRRMGLVEVRYALRVIRGGRDVRREDVAELRRDLASHAAQIGVIFSPADVTREGRGEATQAGQPLVTLLCAEALAEQLVERGLGVSTRTVTVVQLDERALRALGRTQPEAAAPAPAGESKEDRRARRERERREWRERRQKEREERRKAREAEAARVPQDAGELLEAEVLGAAIEAEPAPQGPLGEAGEELAAEVLGAAAADQGEAPPTPTEGAAPRPRRRRRRRSGAAAATAEVAEAEVAEEEAPETDASAQPAAPEPAEAQAPEPEPAAAAVEPTEPSVEAGPPAAEPEPLSAEPDPLEDEAPASAAARPETGGGEG